MTVMHEPMPALPPAPKLKREPPMRHCAYCGAELGRYHDYDPFDNCGRSECQREANAAAREERREAHEALDERMGWSRF